MREKEYNVEGIIRFSVGTNWKLKKCIWVDSFDSFSGIHTPKEYKIFKRKLLKTLKVLDKVQKGLGKK